MNKNKQRIKSRLVDLLKMNLDATDKSYAMGRIVRPDECDLDLNQLYKMGLVQDSQVTA